MSSIEKKIVQVLEKTEKSSKVKMLIKKEFEKAAYKVLDDISDEYAVRVKSAGFRETGDMARNSRIFGREKISENEYGVNIRYGLNVGDEAKMNWKLGGWKWNFFEFKSPNNKNIPILDTVLSGLADKIRKQFKKELSR